MKWFQDRKTSQKIAMLVIFMTILMVFVGGMGFRQLDAAVKDMNAMYEDSVLPISSLNQLQNASRNMEKGLMQYLGTSAGQSQAEMAEAMEAQREELTQLLNVIGGGNMDAREQELFETIKTSLNQYATEMVPFLQEMMNNMPANPGSAPGGMPAAGGGGDDLRFATGQEQLAKIGDAIQELTVYNTEKAKQATLKVKEETQKASSNMLLMIVISAAGGAVFGLLISRQIANPIRRIAAVAEQVAAGDLRAEPMRLKRADELGELANSVDRMMESLKELIHRLADSTGVVEESSRVLLDQAVRTESAGLAISEAVNLTDEGAREQSIKVGHMTGTLQEMAAAIRMTAASGEAAASASTRSAEKAGQGLAVIGKAMKDMEAVLADIQTAASQMSELDREAAHISEIARFITEIASQTNLLALNASIEAARAGEHGRGFAVVAEEVRKLAEESRLSSERATESVKLLRKGTQQAAGLMQDNAMKAQAGVAAALQAGAMFEEIAVEVDRVSELMTDLSAAVQEAFAGSEEIVSQAENLRDIADRSATLSERAAGQAVETVSAMKEIRGSSERLEQESAGLMKLMNSFAV
ncbi:MAG: methyl-accepting chemotaxis sensory transducer [Paenibacillaceae bacterium]|jgi:methyl-accepting chemotaxis protein|nr:methyl-accepting chemotaxis sensory transducer [Paenibacillaceae bacterium]